MNNKVNVKFLDYRDLKEKFGPVFTAEMGADAVLKLLKIRCVWESTNPAETILPLQFIGNVNRLNLNLIGSELISVNEIEKGINPSDKVVIEIKYLSGEIKKIETLCRIDTKNELEYYKNGGILQYVLRKMI